MMEKKYVIRHQVLSSLPQTHWLTGWDHAEHWWSMLENNSGNPGAAENPGIHLQKKKKTPNSSVYSFFCCLWPIKYEQKRSGILLCVYMREEGEWKVWRAEFQEEFTRNHTHSLTHTHTHTHWHFITHQQMTHSHTFSVLHKSDTAQKKNRVTSLSYLRHF